MKSPTSQRVRSSGENRPRRSSSALLVVCLVVAFVVPLMMIATPSASASPGWWNPSWTRRRPVTVTGSHPENYQLKIIVPYDSDMNSDYSDLRFLENADNGTMNYWIENYTATQAIVWVRILENEISGDNTIYMYYGNPSATSQSNENNVFIRVIDNVVGSWSLDEGTGATTADNSGNGNTGTINGATWTTSGKFGNAENFDGTNDNISVSDATNLNPPSAVSVSFWMKLTSMGSVNQTIIIKSKNSTAIDNRSYHVSVNTDNKIHWICASKELTGSATISPAVWYYVSCTFDSSTDNQSIYINGILDNSVANTGVMVNTAGFPLWMGNFPTLSRWYKGLLDEVRIYSKALDSASITDLYNNYGYVTPNYPGRALVRKFRAPEPTASVGAEQMLPGQPSLVSPNNGITTNDNTPTFTWTTGANAENHRLLVDNDSDFSSPEEIQLLGASDNTYTIANENSLPDDNYSWKVIAINAVGENSSSVWTFVVSRVIGRPQLYLPANGSTITDNTPTFEWTKGVLADNHRLLVDNDSNFSTPNENRILTTDNNYTIAAENSLSYGTYYWKVVAINAVGENASSIWNFTVTGTLGHPTLVSPADGTVTSDNTPKFEWTVGAHADNHRLLVDNDNDFLSPNENRLLGASDNTYTIADENSLPNDNYSWKVVAINALGENESFVWTFVVSKITVPGKPTLVSPADGKVTSDNTPTFVWTAGAFADNHRLLVDNDNDFSSPKENRLLGASDNTYTIADENALPDDNYSWKVIAINVVGDNASSVWTFVVSRVLGRPTLVSPADGNSDNDNTPTFVWIIGTYADNHRLLVDNDNDFLSPEENQLLGADNNTYTIADENSLADDNYWWKVIAINAVGENPSSVWTFEVSKIPRKPTLLLPADGTVTSDNTPTFEWTAGAYAENHRLLVDNDNDFLLPNEDHVLTMPTTTCTIAAENSLPEGTCYWKVVAINTFGEATSSVSTFTVSLVTLRVQDWTNRAHDSRATIVFDALPPQYRGNLDGSMLRSGAVAPEYWRLYGAENENTFTHSRDNAAYWLRCALDNYRHNNYDNALYYMGIASYYIGDAMTLPRNDTVTLPGNKKIWEDALRIQYPSGWSLYRYFQEQARYYEPATPTPKNWRPTLEGYITYMLSYLDNYASRAGSDWSYWLRTRDCNYVKSASDNAAQLVYDAWYSLIYQIEGPAGSGGGSGSAMQGEASASGGSAVEARWSFGLLSFGFGAALFFVAVIFMRRSSLGINRRRHHLRKDQRGISSVVGGILVLSIVVVAGATIVTNWIPELELKNEMDHTDAALNTWRNLQQAILNHENVKIEVKLGADPASILGLIEQAPSSGTITVTPAKYVKRILPDNDAYVGEDDSSGIVSSLWVQTYKDNNRRAYLKFDLSCLPMDARIYEARLVVYANISRFPHTWGGKTGCSPVPMLIEVMRVDNDNWSEDKIKWMDNPGYDNALVNEDKPPESTWEISYDEDVGVWYTFNVSSYVKGQRAGNDDLVSLCLKAPVENSSLRRYAWFRSKESPDYRPYLQITYESALENWRSYDNWGSIADSGNVVFDVPNKRYDRYSFVFESGALIKDRYRENPISVTDQEGYQVTQQPYPSTGGPILIANPPLVVGQRLSDDNVQIYVNRYRIMNRASYTGIGKAYLNITVQENTDLRMEDNLDNLMVAVRSGYPQVWVGTDPLLDRGYFTDLAGTTRAELGSLDYLLGAGSSDWSDISVRDFYANAITIYGRKLAAGIKDIKYVERVYDVWIDITAA